MRKGKKTHMAAEFRVRLRLQQGSNKAAGVGRKLNRPLQGLLRWYKHCGVVEVCERERNVDEIV